MSRRQKRVLIADDDGMLREIATGILENAGFAVVTAVSGSAALAACTTQMPDIVLLDVQMSDGDGYEACANIRALPASANVPIVMITSLDDPKSIGLAYQAGATDFIIKPINWPLLVRRIESILKGALTLNALRQNEERMRRLAYVDALTGLPNREWIKSYLSKALVRAEKDRTSCAALFVDLDGFKKVNDTLGHETGDALLAQVAGRLRSALGYCGRKPTTETHEPQLAVSAQVARLGGDEFIVVLTGAVTEESAEMAGRSIRHELNMKFVLAGYEVSVTPSIGMALSPQHGRDAKTLLKNADEAMYLAKSSGRNQFRFYGETLRERASLRSSLDRDLRAALGTPQLQVFYQPQYNTRTLQICGAGALVRWMHPKRGEIPSADLVAVAEDTGLVGDLWAWMLGQACCDINAWRNRGVSLSRLSLNIPRLEFLRPDMPQRLGTTVERAGIAASTFELEIGEPILMGDANMAHRALHSLKQLGFVLAIDDFGSGQCSFNCLKQLPLDTLKIAASFVEEIAKDEGSLAIVRAIIALARKLNMRVVAKGVSSISQLRFLSDEDCDIVQGFLLSPAVAAGRFAALVQNTGPSTQTVRALQLATGSEQERADLATQS